MKWFQVELFNVTDKSAMTALVKAKEYSEACVKLAKIHGEANFKLLGMYEQSEIDKNILNRVT